MDGLRVRIVAALLAGAGLCACAPAPRAAVDAPGEKPKKPDVLYVPTPRDVVDMMLHLARVQADDVVYDLGCGDGRVLVTAAKRYGCRVAGFDIDPARIRESRENVRKHGVGHLARVERRDIFTLDLAGADVVFLYLLPDLNVRLIPQLQRLKPGSRIVSHDFGMEGIRTDVVLRMRSREDDSRHTIHLWTTPLVRQKPSDRLRLPDTYLWEFKMEDEEEPSSTRP
jgi:SAM-dependent methyltransferase